jgi:TonB family protein
MQARRCTHVLGAVVIGLLAVRLSSQSASPARWQRLSSKKAGHLLTSRAVPKYPALARVNYIEGQVVLGIMVTPAGRVAQMHVLRGNPLLAAAALGAVGRWTYHPLVAEGAPSGFCTDVNVTFSLHHRDPETFPQHAEEDFERQVRPPEVLEREAKPGANSTVHLRVLVGEKGEVLDAADLGRATPSALAEARESVSQWKFRSARWGNFDIPWYEVVDVPVRAPATAGAAASAADPPEPECQ